MPKVNIDRDVNKKKRKDKICNICLNYIKESENMEGECMVEEDITIVDYCDLFDIKED